MNGCPNPSEWLLLVDGQVSEERGRQLRGHVEACRQCRSRLAAEEELLRRLAQPIAEPSPVSVERLMARLDQAPPVRRSPLGWVGAGALAAALATGVLLAPRGAPELQARGGEPSDAIGKRAGVQLRRVDDPSRAIEPGAAVPAEAAFFASYRNLEAVELYLAAFGLDASGEIHWLYPGFVDPDSDPFSVPLSPAEVPSALGESVRLESPAPGPMKVLLLVTRAPLRVSQIESLPSTRLTVGSLQARFPDASVEELPLILTRSSP